MVSPWENYIHSWWTFLGFSHLWQCLTRPHGWNPDLMILIYIYIYIDTYQGYIPRIYIYIVQDILWECSLINLCMIQVSTWMMPSISVSNSARRCAASFSCSSAIAACFLDSAACHKIWKSREHMQPVSWWFHQLPNRATLPTTIVDGSWRHTIVVVAG